MPHEAFDRETDVSTPRQPLRVAHVLASFEIGGGERVALDIAATQVERGDTIWAIGLHDGPLAREFRERNVQVLFVPKSKGVDLSLLPRLYACLSWLRADIVHAHDPLSRIYAGAAAQLTSARVVTTMHGAIPDRASRIWLRRAATQLVDAFVVVSPRLTEAARKVESAAPHKISVIENGVDTRRFRPDPAERRRSRAELGVGPGEWVIGTAARLSPEKDLAVLLEASAPLVDRGARVFLAGDGPERSSLEARAAALGIRDRVHFLGVVPDVARFLHALDVFALSSQLEGLPMAILEAMATSLPVVATTVGGVPRAVLEGQTGLLVQPRDVVGMRLALERLRDDPARARALGARGREIAIERFSSRRMQDEYTNLYRQLCKGAA